MVVFFCSNKKIKTPKGYNSNSFLRSSSIVPFFAYFRVSQRRILFKVLSLFHYLLKHLFVPFWRIAILIQQYCEFHVKLILDIVTGRPICKLCFIINQFFDFLCQYQALFVCIRESVIVTHFYQNVIECLFFKADAQLFKRGLVFLQILQNLQQLIGQIINKICNDLTGKHQLITAVIGLHNAAQTLIKFLCLYLVGAPIAINSLDCYIQKVEEQKIQVEPLVIRANAGDCIEFRFTNLLPELLEESAFQMETLTDIVGHHVHLVKFDTIVSDGAANGWNNIAGARKYETLIERFFADTELRTVFFHDHLFANSHQMHGVFGAMIIEEVGAAFHNVRTGEELRRGTRAVIRRRDGTSFREFALFVHDFSFLFDRNGNPLNPPAVPGSHDDPGVMGINYRCEPMRERLKDRKDPAYIFSSLVHGDPSTPVLETYPGDEIIFRLLDGAHEEQHAFNLTGLSWQKELADPHSPYAASQTIGISEAFNLRITSKYAPGDYLYYFGGIDDAWLGLWGILRAHSHPVKHLKPLCKGRDRLLPLPPCPGKDAVIRKYEVAAIQQDIFYNSYGDHDPDGLMFVPLEDAERALHGYYEQKPLILRANAGEWIEVTLHNLFNPKDPVKFYDYPRVPLDYRHNPSMRVSLNPQFLHYDPVCDSGINVGFNNREQTLGPGESKKYLWYADREYGPCLLQSFGDMRNHRYHGLFGAIIIEPAGAKWYRSFSLSRAFHEQEAVITAPGTESFRECVVLIQNGIRMLDAEGNLVKTIQEDGGDIDDEDTGEKGYNYRSERFANRLRQDGRISRIFSSRIHGDPATPLFRAYAGERVIFRTMMPADKPRNVGFTLHGHKWKEQPADPFSRIIPLQGGISIGNTFTMELKDGASCPGDYLYRSGSFKWDVESGMWGIFRVLKRGIGCRCRNACRKLWKHVCKER